MRKHSLDTNTPEKKQDNMLWENATDLLLLEERMSSVCRGEYFNDKAVHRDISGKGKVFTDNFIGMFKV